jgi:hypothetical protein
MSMSMLLCEVIVARKIQQGDTKNTRPEERKLQDAQLDLDKARPRW